MYADSARWHDNRIGFKDRTHSLFVISCGTYHLFTRPVLPTYRPRGRLDFQLLYIASGKAHFYFDGVETIVPAGHMVLYRPRQEQRYYYYGVDQTEVYWVHFTGNNVTNILTHHGFNKGEAVVFTGIHPEYKQIFLQMIQELKLCKADYETALTCHLQLLFIFIDRFSRQNQSDRPCPFAKEMDIAVRYFQENYRQNIRIDQYAAAHGMSAGWFIRTFKEYTGLTPARYLLSLRMSHSQDLLENTDCSIAEIAEIVGYENPLYFSRVFKKQTGISPSGYRKQHL